tara:strand:- start:1448 stop:1777 length:330 start_codon:yes stop_codon:yes gene_type:complete
MFDKLKKKWAIDSNFHLLIIIIVFGITGSLSVLLTTPILDFFDFKKQNFESYFLGDFFYYSIKFISIFPLYNLILLLIATVFFQFNFFWNFQKKMFSKLGLSCLFSKRK